MAATPGGVGITPGAGANVAVWIEPVTGRDIQRNALSDPLGNPLTIGGMTSATLVTPAVTVNVPYGANFVIGGLLTFTGVFGSTGSGVIRSARVTCKQKQFSGLTLFLFNLIPTGFADDTVAAIVAADVSKVLMGITMSPLNQLGTHTIWSASVDAAVDVNAANLYGVLVIDAALDNKFTTTTDIVVELTITQDIGL